MRPRGIIEVPQISRIYTDFFDLFGRIYTDFFDTPVPLCEEGVLIPLPSPHPYHKGKGCSWRRYSSARVLVSQRSLCPKGLAESAYAIKLRLFVA